MLTQPNTTTATATVRIMSIFFPNFFIYEKNKLSTRYFNIQKYYKKRIYPLRLHIFHLVLSEL